MIMERGAILARRVHQFDIYLCLFANKACQRRLIKHFFSAISRLGNGVFWYVLMGLIPFLYGLDSGHVSLRMLLVGVVGLVIYKLIKSLTERPRPYNVNKNIMLGTSPLDQYSFPSGHTLHAVSFTLTAIYYLPELSWLLIPFTSLIALSRVILGLHYPTDVVAGAVIGSLLGLTNIAYF